jgi:galactokinase
MPYIARAPGRVNLIGDHTDYTGGLVLPMAIDRWTDIRFSPLDGFIEARSKDLPGEIVVPLPVAVPQQVEPAWGRYIAAVAAEMHAEQGFRGSVSTTIPVGAGLSSSAALEIAAGLALGFEGSALALAQLCRRAELVASGVPCGIMDQLVIAGAVDGHALMIDCSSYEMTPVALPEGVEIVVEFVAHRTLQGSEYAERVAECSAAEVVIGSLATASLDAVAAIADATVRHRARHVISENTRVRDFATALAAGDLASAGEFMVASHRSLATDFATSTSVMDDAVAALIAIPGVFGARMTGGGFGGCTVALAEAGALQRGWVVHPVRGAHIIEGGD